jgi:hypothetical protein
VEEEWIWILAMLVEVADILLGWLLLAAASCEERKLLLL